MVGVQLLQIFEAEEMFSKIREMLFYSKLQLYDRGMTNRKKIFPVQNVAVAGSHHYHSLSQKCYLFACTPQGNGITRKI